LRQAYWEGTIHPPSAEWLVYVPYRLGYGTRTANYVPAYSTLIFDILLSGYSRAGVKVTDGKAKKSTIWIEE